MNGLGVTTVQDLMMHKEYAEVAQLEPEPDGSESYETFLSSRYKAEKLEVSGTDEQFEIACAYARCNDEIKAVEEKQRLHSNTLKVAMANAETMTFGAKGKVSWSENKKGSRVFTVKVKL
jgi:hypothetical protein